MTTRALGGGRRGRRLAALLAVLAPVLAASAAGAYDRVVALRWTQPEVHLATGYVAYVGSETGEYGETRDLGAVAPRADGVHQADLVLDALVPHYVALASYNDAGTSAPSNEVTVSAVACDPVFCEDGNPCTADACGDGACVHDPVADGTSCAGGLCQDGACQAVECLADLHCSDGNACNGAELCVGNACRPGTAPSCAGASACTDSSCDPVLGCVTRPKADGTVCDDGSPGTTGDRCLAGTCAGTPVVEEPPPDACGPSSCDDGRACTVDTCLEGGGCSYVPAPDGAACDDGLATTVGDQCRVGQCIGTLEVDPAPPPTSCGASCSDGNTCTSDACGSSGCLHLPLADGTACDDGIARTTRDLCRRGVCKGKIRL